MAPENIKKVFETAGPRGLMRLVLIVLAETADTNGHLSFSDTDAALLARRCAMNSDRFSRNVRELDDAGYLEQSDRDIVLTIGGLGAAEKLPPEQPSLLPVDDDLSDESSGVVGGESVSAEIDAVLAHYVDVMVPRDSTFGEEERREVRASLKVRTVSQCKEAIDGNRASGYHQGENDREKKYNRISHIFRGKKGRRTRAENIDMFREIAAKAKATTGTIRSDVDPAIVATKKEEVRRGHRLPGEAEAVRRTADAERWLREHGVETRRRSDGYPIWPDAEDA